MEPLITSRTDWTNKLIYDVYKHIEEIALEDMQLDVYQNQIEIISAEQMIDAYASIGMPVHYNHWSFGKDFLRNWHKYQKGRMGLAYEIVINSDPCISYLMEENPAITQALVIAHAAFGHNFVFKNNYLFREGPAASSIIDFMVFAKNYIREQELKYGEDEVEKVLDAAHALAPHGIDKHKRKYKKRLKEHEKLAEDMKKADEEQLQMDIIRKRTSIAEEKKTRESLEQDEDLVGDEENLLYFLFKNSPVLPEWKREILRIVYRIHQYFYPQGQSKVLNEGFATFTHFHIMNELEKRGVISSDAQIAWLHLHSNVITQPSYSSKHYSGFNPYALGLSVFNDIKRVCENPTAEDAEWFPHLAGTDWKTAVKQAASDFRDESFIQQYMSPELIRRWHLFTVDVDKSHGVVTEISDDRGYKNIRKELGAYYNPVNFTPDLVIRSARMKGDRLLTLEYRSYRNRHLLASYAYKTLEHVKRLWGYDVEIVEFKDEDTELRLFST